MEPIILIGGGGHCIACIDVIRSENKYEIIGIVDTPDKIGGAILNVPFIGTDDDVIKLLNDCKNYLITVGQIKSPAARIRLFQAIKTLGGIFPVIKSSLAYVSSSASVDAGTIIMHSAIINAKAVIGKNCIINTGALIEHEVVVGNFCHISTHAVVNGQGIVGNQTFLGSNSVIANNVIIPDGCVISAGAFVSKSPVGRGTYRGNPATRLER